MLCGLALMRIELPQSSFFQFSRLVFLQTFFTPKNTLVIVAQILLYAIYLILRYRKEIRFKRTKRFLYPNAILLRYVLIHKIFSNRKHTIFIFLH